MDKEGELNFVALFWIVWDQKYLVLAISLACGVIATILALTAIPIFRSQVVVTEVHDTGLGGAGALMGQLGGLASIAGLNLNANGPDAERSAVLQSRGLIEAFIKRYNLSPLINGNSKNRDSVWYATERFRKNVFDLHEEKLKGTTTITIDWTDPAVAARWANGLVGLANDLLRNRAIDVATRNVEYLNKQLANTNVVEIQHSIYGLIEAETKNLMLAHGRTEYAFTIVDPAVPAEIRYSPRRTLMVASGLFIGGILGSLVALVRRSLQRHPPPTTN